MGLNALNWVYEKGDDHVKQGEAMESLSFQRLRESGTLAEAGKCHLFKHDGKESSISSPLIISASPQGRGHTLAHTDGCVCVYLYASIHVCHIAFPQN